MTWPDYCKKTTLAKRLDLPEGAIDQYLKRGLLPPPMKVGDALLWRWSDVDAALSGRKTVELVEDDPYSRGARNAAKAAPSRQQGQKPG